jgi:hypothetical protein
LKVKWNPKFSPNTKIKSVVKRKDYNETTDKGNDVKYYVTNQINCNDDNNNETTN